MTQTLGTDTRNDLDADCHVKLTTELATMILGTASKDTLCLVLEELTELMDGVDVQCIDVLLMNEDFSNATDMPFIIRSMELIPDCGMNVFAHHSSFLRFFNPSAEKSQFISGYIANYSLSQKQDFVDYVNSLDSQSMEWYLHQVEWSEEVILANPTFLQELNDNHLNSRAMGIVRSKFGIAD